MDGDTEFPTINGTGTEDYFCGSYDFDTRKKNEAGVEELIIQNFQLRMQVCHQVIRGDGHYNIMQRFGMYRWHIMDPIRFEKRFKGNYTGSGWRSGGRYLVQQSILLCCFLVPDRTTYIHFQNFHQKMSWK